jgi:MFS family permease
MRNYQLFIVGLVVSNVGTWMQRVAQSWLILQITNGNGSALGITTGLQFLPVLLIGAWGGIVVDRYSRRRLVLLTQICMGLLALILAVLDVTGTVRVWHVYTLAFLLGLFNVFDNPGRNALLSEIVGAEGLASAVGLNSACFNLSRMVGPALGGVILAVAGTATAFFINAASFLAVVLTLCALRRSEMFPAPRVPRQTGQIREGLRYIAQRPDLVLAMTVIACINAFALNFQITLPLMARQALMLPASAYGVLFGAVAAGSIAGALLSARRARPRLRVMLAAAAALGIFEVLSALAPTFWALFGLLLAVGATSLTVSTTSNTMVQLGSAPELRGRTMALYFFATSAGRPLGAPVLGGVAGWLGPRSPMLFAGLASITIALAGVGYLGWRTRRSRLAAPPEPAAQA